MLRLELQLSSAMKCIKISFGDVCSLNIFIPSSKHLSLLLNPSTTHGVSITSQEFDALMKYLLPLATRATLLLSNPTIRKQSKCYSRSAVRIRMEYGDQYVLIIAIYPMITTVANSIEFLLSLNSRLCIASSSGLKGLMILPDISILAHGLEIRHAQVYGKNIRCISMLKNDLDFIMLSILLLQKCLYFKQLQMLVYHRSFF